jgi:type I restriction-modification system DNA methylase subunit
MSLLFYFGIIPKTKIEGLSIEDVLEEYRKQLQKHNLLLWNEHDIGIDSLKRKIGRQLFDTISEFVFKCNRESAITLLGTIYESLHEEGSRKRKGAYFTPSSLAQTIFLTSFEQLSSKQNLSEILNLRILDNACGGGVFLISSVESTLNIIHQQFEKSDSRDLLKHRGIDAENIPSILNYIISKMIHGVDKDPIAIAVAEAQLWLLLASAHGTLEKWQWNIPKLSVCDSLTDSSLLSDRYDLIIGNPPYMRLSSLDSAYQQILRNTYEARREFNLHALFITKSLEQLRKGGVLGYLLHKNIFTLDTYNTLRHELMNNHTCVNLVDCGQFKGVTAETAFIVLKKGAHNPNSSLALATYDSKNRRIFERLSIEQDEYAKLISHWNYRFIINLNDDGKNLLAQFRDLDCLGDYATISRGIETGANTEFISHSPEPEGTWLPLLRGRDISAYYGNQQTFLNYNRNRLSKPGRDDLLSLPKIILQQNARHPIAYFDDGNFLVLNSTTYLTDASSELLKTFCVFLNSQLISWLFRTAITNNASLTVNILPNNLSLLPVPSDFNQNVFAKLCDVLQFWKTCKENTLQSETQFNTWYHTIVEAAVCEAYLPTLFDYPRIQNLIQKLIESKALSQVSLNSKEYKQLLSIAKDVVSHNLLDPVRQVP